MYRYINNTFLQMYLVFRNQGDLSKKEFLYLITDHLYIFLGEQLWHSGESARLSPMRPGFKSWARCHKWVEFAVGSCPCSEGFSLGFPVFLTKVNINFSKFQFDREFKGHRFVSCKTVVCHPC